MKKQIIGYSVIVLAFGFGSLGISNSVQAQGPLQIVTESAHRHTDYHAGIHSGSWTLKREQILEEESKDKYRSCRDPYCNRCSKHLADYGHEYQYIGGPSQRQLWYRGTAGSIAHVTQRCYDEHGMPYARRCRPGAVMSWEYQRVLNHAIWEQVQARNAVAVEEAAEERVRLLDELQAIALGLLEKSEARWSWMKEHGLCAGAVTESSPCCGNTTYVVREGVAMHMKNPSLCEYCAAKARYEKDCAYVAAVQRELAGATQEWHELTAIADEAVRIALLSKDDADRATRFKRIQHKPPKYKEVLAAQEAAAERNREPTKIEAKPDTPKENTTNRVALPRG